MSLITCPECAHEVSSTATACPNCGHPFAAPVVHRKVVVTEAPERDDFPKWIFIPLGLLGVVLLFVLIAFMRRDDNADGRNINVSVNTQRPAGGSLASDRTTTTSIPSESSTVVVPPSSTMSVPPMSTTTAPPTSSQTISGAPGSTITAPAPDKGTVTLEAKIQTSSGGVQPVRAERFYLLDKDLESILSEAGIEDETGQGLVNAYGLAVVYPSRYADTNRKVASAIAKHIVYRAQTDGSGKASMKDVKPDSYYLYGITKTASGFAVWSSPVSINAGQNELNLSPARLTEISQ
ncbi:MAG TPA: zinc ribbon domain-containing protein [Pyrinomonadaceae bacterium]|nr:zinc ribbon domain-containing protein [Pyrinomonadaceae bacterium]